MTLSSAHLDSDGIKESPTLAQVEAVHADKPIGRGNQLGNQRHLKPRCFRIARRKESRKAPYWNDLLLMESCDCCSSLASLGNVHK